MMSREPTLLDDIYVGEEEDITAPCARSLKAGESITTVVVTCTWLKGVADASAGDRVTTPNQVLGTDIVQRVIGHVAGAWYLLDFFVTLNSGRKLVGQGIFYAKPRGTS